MQFTIVKQYMEEGSRPGKVKMNLVQNTDVFEAETLEQALDIFERRADHAIRISYSQSALHTAYLFEGDVTAEGDDHRNIFTQDVVIDGKKTWQYRKKWRIENEDVVRSYDRLIRGSERPASWSRLRGEHASIVAAIDKVSPHMANRIASQFLG